MNNLNDALATLHAELRAVDDHDKFLLFAPYDLHPVEETYDPTTGAFVAYNDDISMAIGAWVKNAQLYITEPVIASSSIERVQYDQRHNYLPLKQLSAA